MIYSVKAKLIPEKMEEFLQSLTDGTIENQKPDGAEIVSSMKRAKFTEPGIVEWSEMCFCSPPLKHERETVYDKYFSEMKISTSDDYKEFRGTPFFEYLTRLDKQAH